MRKTVCVCGILILIYAASNVSCLTNSEFYDLVKDYITEETILESSEESDDVDDDVIDLPGGPDDDLDIERLIKQLGEPYEEDDEKSTLEYTQQRSLSRASCRCRRHYCQCCVSKTFKVRVWRHRIKFRLRACLKAELRRGGFEISFTLNGRRVLHRRYSLRRGISLCYRVPQFPAAKICLSLYNINLRRRSMCARLTGKVNLRFKKFKVHLKLGCFRIGDYDENSVESLDSHNFRMAGENSFRNTGVSSYDENPLFAFDAIDDLDLQENLDLEDASTDDVDSYNDLDISDASIEEQMFES